MLLANYKLLTIESGGKFWGKFRVISNKLLTNYHLLTINCEPGKLRFFFVFIFWTSVDICVKSYLEVLA